jgi:regulator of sigma E protease
MSYLATLFIIGGLIFVHELGHLLAAWAVGIPVARFSVGFGPVLWVWRRGGVEYCLSLIPLGGYVLPAFDDEADFLRTPARRRVAFWLGGPLANFACAVLLLSIARPFEGDFSPIGLLVLPWIQIGQITVAFLAALPGIFLHPQQLSGIVGIVAVGHSVMAGGVLSVLRFAVMLNVNLAIFNLLPMAPLDGGKIFCALLEKIHPRLGRLHHAFAMGGIALLLILMLYTTVLDVVRQMA